jgi:phenol 2-monooxygenase (NADPH)
LLDAVDATGKLGGKLYETYGVCSEGAVVVVRPDGYVGSVTGLDDITGFEQYFAGFLTV